jgi:pyruvate/2-oxoglutarate dehydrogenase complex dihydrolipoamide acyltransferase (E2) component
LIAEHGLDDLRAPPARLAMPDVAGIPASGPMEDFLIPDRLRIAASLRALARIDRGQRSVVALNGRAPASAQAEAAHLDEAAARRTSAWADIVSVASQQIPQASSVVEVDLSHAARRLERDRQAWRARGLEPTFTAYFAEALLAAVREAPHVNAAFDDQARGIRRHAAVHLGVSLASPDAATARHGVIRDADTRNVLGLAMEMDAVRSSGANEPDVLANATLSLADYGPGSALFAVPLVLPGQVAAVRAGVVEERLVVRERGFALSPTAYLCASIDHRALDGMDAGTLLGAIKRVLEAA